MEMYSAKSYRSKRHGTSGGSNRRPLCGNNPVEYRGGT